MPGGFYSAGRPSVPPTFGPSLPVCLRRAAATPSVVSRMERPRHPQCEALGSALRVSPPVDAPSRLGFQCTHSVVTALYGLPAPSSFGLGRTDGRPREGLHTLSRIHRAATPPLLHPRLAPLGSRSRANRSFIAHQGHAVARSNLPIEDTFTAEHWGQLPPKKIEDLKQGHRW